MKHIRLSIGIAFILPILSGCKPADDAAAVESRRQLEQAQAENARQAEELQQRSASLQQQLADLQKAMQEKETAELKARLETIRQENERLAADAEAARRRSLSLAEELERERLPRALPYVPPAAPAPATGPWMSPDDDYSLFYDSLRPYGRWLEVDGQGYAFRPGLADRPGWRPYMDGRWTWTDQGWAWDTNEPFGWACYHYGRWVQVSRHGWLWVPGREWAPAWVSWRRGDDCVGWAPLPPGAGRTTVGHDCDVQFGLGPGSYTFISASNFGRTSYVNASLSTVVISRIFQQTVNVTNIVPSHHGSVFTQRGGPPLDWVERHCGSRVVRAPVRFGDRLDHAPDARRSHEHGQPGFNASPLEIVRGRSKPGIPPIAGRIQQPVMLDTWKDVPEDRRPALKEAMLRQAGLPQPRPALADTPRPAEPIMPKQPETDPAAPVTGLADHAQPGQPSAGMPPGDDRRRPHAGPGHGPGFPGAEKGGPSRHEPGMDKQETPSNDKAPRPGMFVEQGRQPQPGGEQAPIMPAADKNAAEAAMKAREEEAARLQQELARQQTAMEARRAQADEQERQNQGRRQEMEKAHQEKLMEETRSQETKLRRHQEEMAARQAEIGMRKNQQDAAMAARQEAQAEQTLRQQETRRLEQQQEAAMKARQEAQERQQQMELQRQQQEAAMKAQQEAQERQQQMELQRQQQEAAMRAAQEAAERQREAAERAQREAMERAQREAAEREREMQRQQEEARRQAEEAARRQAEEAARRAAEEAARQQGQ